MITSMALVATATWDGPTVRMATAGAATATAATAREVMARVEVLYGSPWELRVGTDKLRHGSGNSGGSTLVNYVPNSDD